MPLAALPWACLALAAWAAGQPRLRLQAAPGLPFDEQQLVDALALRAQLAGAEAAGDLAVAVEPSGPGRVAIAVAGRRVEAEVGASTGADAARLVALLVVDAAQPPLVFEGEPAPRPGRLSLFLAPAVNLGLSDAGVSLEPTAGVGWQVTREGRLLASLGYARARAVDRKGTELMVLDTVPVRAGVGWLLGPVELAGGLVVRGFRAGAEQRTLGARPGAWLEASWSLPLSGPLRPFLLAALDGHLERLELRRSGRPLLSAGYLAPWLGVGVSWRRSR